MNPVCAHGVSFIRLYPLFAETRVRRRDTGRRTGMKRLPACLFKKPVYSGYLSRILPIASCPPPSISHLVPPWLLLSPAPLKVSVRCERSLCKTARGHHVDHPNNPVLSDVLSLSLGCSGVWAVTGVVARSLQELVDWLETVVVNSRRCATCIQVER
ncbi:hypothetical protein C2E23DRAFT_547960 [Lenzites betulinus]|nr:hypothetical protein C2E23DRAFT_547960 [Lenzites betulinus]